MKYDFYRAFSTTKYAIAVNQPIWKFCSDLLHTKRPGAPYVY